jgi:basic amino acid/polyamine antiporter, APA family
MSLFRTKTVAQLVAEASQSTGLKRELTATNLVSLGIGSVIGAGVFVLSGQTAAQYAGPGIAISFIISGLASLFAGLCYAEFASMIPIAGSAYTYTYATMGEMMAWIIGWDLMLEYLFSAAAVAVGWSANAQGILQEFGLKLPAALAQAPVDFVNGHFVVTGAWFDLPAVLISLALTVVLVIGIRESATFNNLMVFTKVGVLLVLIAYGTWFLLDHPGLASTNWLPFIPENHGPAIRFFDESGHFSLFRDLWNFVFVSGQFGAFGWSGIFKGAAVIFFAYIGFDSVSCAAQEAKNPQRDMPIGLLVCLAICVGLFVAVSMVLTGMIHYSKLNVDAPFIFALQQVHAPALLRYSVELAALAGLTSVILISMLGQPRIFFSMANDGLLPQSFSKVHPRFGTPYVTTILTGVVCAITAGLTPLNVLGELISIGTLMAFAIVCIGILILRKTQPDMPRPFRTPWVPLVPLLGAGTCLLQTVFLPPSTWIRLAVWMGLGFAVYFGYSRKHSKLRTGT